MKKKILVTGAGGFIGSHLVEQLVVSGQQVKAFVHYNSRNSWGWLDSLDKKILNMVEVFPGDIRDPYNVRRAVNGVETIFHLAALIAIPYSYISPQSYIDINTSGTLNLLQSAKDFKIKKFIHTSTSEVYGSAQYVPIDEDHPLQGQSPYSASKIGADKIVESFYRSFDLPVITARPFNTYGPRQSARAVIPTMIIQLLSGKTKIQLGSLHPCRDWVYVKDTVEAFIEIAKTNLFGQTINIATQRDASIGDLARKLIALINPQAEVVQDISRLRPKNSEVDRLLGNNSKIKKLTAWKINYTLEKGLKQTIEWVKANIKEYKPEIYNI